MAAGTEKKKVKGKAKAARETAAVVTASISPPIPRLVRFNEYPVADVLNRLLADKTADENIRFATDGYSSAGLDAATQITAARILRDPELIRPRVGKSRTAQSERTKRNAEVFTPARLCKKMVDFLDLEMGWQHTDADGWHRYVDTRALEITCGEAPFIVSRYDAATGHPIPLAKRIGILDRKLRVVNESAAGEKEWVKWALRSLESVYGFEYQGDSLLLARANLLITFAENLESRWGRRATGSELTAAANRIVWNFWQMDGLTGAVPKYGDEKEPQEQYLPGFEECAPEKIPVQEELPWEDEFLAAKNTKDTKSAGTDTSPGCILFDWRARRKVIFNEIKKGTATMRFDYAIGNPPYQEDVENAGDRPNPVYDEFMDEAYRVADKVELITPGRFLFNAGQTSKAWNAKMLSDPHLKVLEYAQRSDSVFANTDITGGVAITYRDATKECGKIGAFTSFPELNDILHKVLLISSERNSLSRIVSSQGVYRFSEELYKEYPSAADAVGAGTGNKIVSRTFQTLPEVFLKQPNGNVKGYIKIIGRSDEGREVRFVKKKYIEPNEYLELFNVLVPEANGSGAIGAVLSTPIIGFPLIAMPMMGFTDTFISIGKFDSEDEAESCLKYIKTKFARTLLGVLKITQHNTKSTWRYVPLQDFTSASDIDWSGTVAEIDAQLYRKYGLTKKEIAFIESHVKEME